MENEEVILPEGEEIETDFEEPEGEEVDWKAEAEKWRGIAKRNQTKLEKKAETKTEIKEEPKKTDNLDYGQLAYLTAKGIEDDGEIGLIQDFMKNTGKSLMEAVKNKYVQAEIKELREAKTVQEATPTASRRTAPSGKNTVDYWIAKGELPPADQVQLRREVLNKRIETEKQRSKFSDNPVVSSI